MCAFIIFTDSFYQNQFINRYAIEIIAKIPEFLSFRFFLVGCSRSTILITLGYKIYYYTELRVCIELDCDNNSLYLNKMNIKIHLELS